MKFFRNPLVSFLLAAMLVLGSTQLSVREHFGDECEDMSELFYEGTVLNGEPQPAIASSLRVILNNAEKISKLAGLHSLDTQELEWRCEDLELAFTYSEGSASYIHYCYEELMTQLEETGKGLSQMTMSPEDQALLQRCNDEIAAAQDTMLQSNYNELVREFHKENDRFPTAQLADLAGVMLPEYFA